MEIEILVVNKERSFNELAIVFIRYHQLCLRCKLAVGYNESKKSVYHYLVMPFINLKCKIDNRLSQKRVNVANWPNEKISKDFQERALSLLRVRYPELFSISESVVKSLVKDRKKAYDSRKEGKLKFVKKERVSA